jgi:hypothetical protein
LSGNRYPLRVEVRGKLFGIMRKRIAALSQGIVAAVV